MNEMINSQLTGAQRRGVYKTIAIILIVIVVLFLGFLNKILSPRILSNEELRLNGAIAFKQPRIIREFTLVDHNSQSFNLERLKGTWTLAFFGFTQCPDICPATLSKLNQVVSKLDKDIAENTQVILVSLDPARDTTEKLKEYVPYFNSEFIGVTGEFLEIMRLTRDVNVAFGKVKQGEGYTIDHSLNLVLFNPNGHYHGFFKSPLEIGKLKLTYSSIVKSFEP